MLLHFIPTKPTDNYHASPLSGFQYSQHHLGSVVGTFRHSAYIVLLNPHDTGKYVSQAHVADGKLMELTHLMGLSWVLNTGPLDLEDFY